MTRQIQTPWLNEFLARVYDAAYGRLHIINNSDGLDWNLKENPQTYCEVCLRFEEGEVKCQNQ